ncbi:hypothetical protein GCM10020366_44280 [Saccharopolyspora gregorii]|uniref:Uncharacterized protein n=1 Tax=Saccharopolyspora gregorii TaxID=33914 RepID=A0ABP6RVW1_9PSEU
MRARPASAACSLTSETTTSSPLRALTSAMPAPMSPEPTTPTRSIPVTTPILPSDFVVGSRSTDAAMMPKRAVTYGYKVL